MNALLSRRLPRAALPVCLGLAALATAPAATNSAWTGAAGSDFEAAGSWSALPQDVLGDAVSGSVAVFGNPVTANLPQLTRSRSLYGMSFSAPAGGWTLGAAQNDLVLTLGAGGVTTAGQTSGVNTIAPALSVGANQTWQVGAGGTLRLTGNLSFATPAALTVGSTTNNGTLVLNPAAGNITVATTFSGTLLNVAAGTLELGTADGNGTTGTHSISNAATAQGNTALRIASAGLVRVLSGTWNFSDGGANSSSGFAGRLQVSGGTVTFGGLRYVAAGAVIAVDGGTLKVRGTGFSVVNGGYLGIGGAGSGTATLNLSEGLVDLAKSATVHTLASTNASGLVNQTGGRLQVGLTAAGNNSMADLNIGSTTAGRIGAYTLAGGELVVAGEIRGAAATGGGLSNFNFLGGNLTAGTFTATNLGSSVNATATSNQTASSTNLGTLVNRGGTLAPGGLGTAGRLALTGNYTATAGALAVDIGGATAATAFQTGGYDLVAVTGNVTLGGNLTVSLVGGYAPANSANFTVLTAGNVTGSFANVASGARLDVAGGLGSFLVTVGATNVRLSQYIPPPVPVITGQPQSVVVPPGLGVRFSVTATGAQSYQWRKGGQPLDGQTAATLSLPAVTAADAGSYDCVLTNAAGNVTTMPASLAVLANLTPLPAIPAANAGNPHFATMFNEAKPGNTVDLPNVNSADEILATALAYIHPSSPFLGRQDYADRLKFLIDQLSATWASGTVDDMSLGFQVCYGYYVLKTYRPDQITAEQQALWETNIRVYAEAVLRNSDLFVSHYVGALWLNGDIRKALGAYFGFLALGDVARANIAAGLLEEVIPRAVLPDGGTRYVGYQNENFTYHAASLEYMAWWYVLTGSVKMRAALEATKNYVPLTTHPLGKGFGDYTTSPAWKAYYNTGVLTTAALIKAYVTGDGFNFRIGQGAQDPLLAFLYTPGLTAKTLPDNFLLYDRNTCGPRGRFGTWGVVGSARDVSDPGPELRESYPPIMDGMNTFAGAYVLNGNASATTYPINAAFHGAAPAIKTTNTATAEDWMRGDDWNFCTGLDTHNAVTKSRAVHGISTRYDVSDRRFVATKWQANQQWVFTAERVIGLSEIQSKSADQLYGLIQRIALVSGRRFVSGTKKVLASTGTDQWSYGNLNVKVHGRTYTGPVNTFEFGIWNGVGDTFSTMIELHDAASSTNQTTTTSYPAGTTRSALIETTPAGTAFSGNATALTGLPTGLRGFEFSETTRKVRFVANITAAPVAYSANLTTPYARCRVLRSWDETALVAPAVAAGLAPIAETIPAFGHILILTSNVNDDHQLGYRSYATVFDAAGVTDTTPPTLTVPADFTVTASGPSGAAVSFNATATDAVDGTLMPVCAPASGSFLPIGTTTVNATAMDASGNVARRSFTVTVETPATPRPAIAYRFDVPPAPGYARLPDGTGQTIGTLDTANSPGSLTTSPLPVAVTGPRSYSGAAYDFSSANSTAYLTIAGPAVGQIGNLAQSTGFSTAFWVKDTYDASRLSTRLFGFTSTFEASVTSASGVGRILFEFGNTGQFTVATPTTNGGVFNGQWHHVALSVDFATATNNVRLYVDGALVSTTSANVTTSFNVTAPSSTFLPFFFLGANSSGGTPYRGQIAEFLVYPAAISAARVSQLYAGGADLTAPTLNAPGNLTATAPDATGAVVPFTVTATDAADGPLTPTASPASGSKFPVGVSVVNATATDASGNVGRARFTVTVAPPLGSGEFLAPRSEISGADLVLSVPATVNTRTYQLQKCTDLAAGVWQDIGAPRVGDGQAIQFTVPFEGGSPRVFYRLKLGP